MTRQSDGAIGRKDDLGKLRYDLLPPNALREVAKVLTHGAAKYAPYNWQVVDDAKARYTAALMRHFEAWRDGETFDLDSHLPHLAHTACNALFLLWFELKGDK